MVTVQQLGRVLPDRYAAAPRVHVASEIETNTLDYDARAPDVPAAWAPAAPTLAVETELADADEYEVRVYDAQHGRRLVAAVEIVSPVNKDRPERRAQFVAKCAALLRQRVCVLIVDVVTVPEFNLYAELLDWIGEHDAAVEPEPSPVYAVAGRWRPRGAGYWLEAWNRPLAIGEPLPVLPLWLSDDLAIPLDLEASYEQTCRDLRIPSV